jgi:nitroimidazol reductase NimA-like FMN-containing flavoprotein (pyridoxamine 5'-phosphate oxidase superfamily)
MATNARTGLEELTEDQSWRLLAKKSVGRLAVSIGNQPDVFPVNYRIDGGSIVVRTEAGLKLAAAVLGRSVAFEVDAIDEFTHTGWSVVLKGEATEIQGTDELLEAEDLKVEPWAGGPKSRYIRITADTVSGRRVPDTGHRKS